MLSMQLRGYLLVVAALILTPAGVLWAQDDTARVKVQMPPERAMTGYLKLGEIKGESLDKDHKEWIDILSVDWDGSATARGSRQVVITRNLDKASPKILEAIAGGKAIPEVELDAPPPNRDAGTQPYLRYKLERVLITSYSVDATGDVPTETITLNFEKISQSPDVQLKGKKILEN